MEAITVERAIQKIRIYLRQNNFRPYFVISDKSARTADLKKTFKELEKVNVSDFCKDDYPLDADMLIEKLNSLSRDALCFGLGEYIYFTAQDNILRSLQDKSFQRKIIFVCRGISYLIERLADEDLKFRSNNVCKLLGKENFSTQRFSSHIDIKTDAQNFSGLLKLAERGKCSISVKTDLPLVNVKEINSFYEAIKISAPHLSIRHDALEEEQWREYFFDNKCSGYPPDHWRSFAVGFKSKIENPYLRYVFEHSTTYEEYRKNLFFALLNVVEEKTFNSFYTLRKAAVGNISTEYLAEYLIFLSTLPEGSNVVKYLTDNTAEERRAMIVAVQGKDKIPSVFKRNYQAMRDYLVDYDFGDEVITNYFKLYKRIKLSNVDDEDFKRQVNELALERPANKFETRQAILERVGNAKLYWLDALGVEFLSYIKLRATRAGLSVQIKIARADLPTLTSTNKNFYDEWQGDKFIKNPKLDDLKHLPEKFNDKGKCSPPTYIDDELRIIDEVIKEIRFALTQNKGGKIILTSDHGASRLAVMYGREIKHKLQSVGEHGGRCCPTNELDEKPSCATEENDYWVLANYNRFVGGRLSSVEVHGGATLEETLVPVIEFTLKGAKSESKPVIKR